MYLNHSVLAKINQVFSQLTMQALLLDTNGHVILPENSHNVFKLPEGLLQNPTTPYVFGSYTLIGTGDKQPIFLCIAGNSDEVVSCIRVTCELLKLIIDEDQGQATQGSSIRMILSGEIEETEITAICAENNIDIGVPRCVIFMHFSGIDSEEAVKIVTNLIENEPNDYVCEISRHSIALVKSICENESEEDVYQYAEALQNTFITESGNEVIIGIGEIKPGLMTIGESLNEARDAINIGRLYHPKKQIFVSNKMILERFLMNISEDTAMKFHQMLFNKKNAKLFNEEMLTTIEKFFENSLNLSETARQLYIHRNTLVYRLDKIQRMVGLDLRAFDDALTFKLLLLMGKQGSDKKNRF